MTLAYLLLGLVSLLAGGEGVVRGARALAFRLRIPPAVIGSTVLAIGTSLPELFVSVGAALQGHPEIAVCNVVGSNIYNVLLILGVAACVFPLTATRSTRRIDLPFVVGSTLALCVFGQGGLTRIHGVLLLAGLGLYLWTLVANAEPEEHPESGSALWLLPGFVGILAGAEWFVTGAHQLASSVGMSERVIGLTVVAIGTSLPELVTSVTSAWRGDAGLAIGNVLGSNAFNILGILGVTSLLAPGAALPLLSDQVVLCSAALVAAGFLWGVGGLTRPVGAVLLGCAVLYTGFLVAGPAA